MREKERKKKKKVPAVMTTLELALGTAFDGQLDAVPQPFNVALIIIIY